jgi:hypothetical protein
MNRRLTLSIALALATACGGDDKALPDSTAIDTVGAAPFTPPPTCTDHRITGDGIGALRIGLPVDSVSLLCKVTRDTLGRDIEGMMARVLSVAIDSDTVLAEISDMRVWRILVRSQELYTVDSLSVGSSIKMLTSLPDLNPMVGEGYLYVTSSAHCGLSFRLSEPPSAAPHGEWKSADLATLAAKVHVTRILIFGCTTPR